MSIRPAGKKKQSLRRLWVGVVSGLVVIGGLLAAAYWLELFPFGQAGAASAATTTVESSPVRRGSLRSTITGVGVYAAGNTADLSFSTAGQVVELNAALGDMVAAGDVLARIGDTEGLSADVTAARVKLLQAQADLETLQNSAPVSLAQAYVDWITAQSAYEDALTAQQRTAYARCSQDVNTRYAHALKNAQERLAKNAEGSEAYTNAKNDLATAQANYDYCVGYSADEKTSAQAELDLATSELAQTEQTYNLVKENSGLDPQELEMAEAAVEEAGAALKQAQTKLEGSTLTAPISGRVTYLAAQTGENVTAGDTFITISDVSQPVMSVQVDETDLTGFQVGSKAEIVFDALSDETFTGTLTSVSPQVSSGNNVSTLSGVINLDANENLLALPIGMNATVEIIVAEADDALLIPLEALNEMPDGSFNVTVLDASGAETQRAVTVGLKSTAFAQIVEGLSEGEVVVIQGTVDINAASQNNPFMQIGSDEMPVPQGGRPGMP